MINLSFVVYKKSIKKKKKKGNIYIKKTHSLTPICKVYKTE